MTEKEYITMATKMKLGSALQSLRDAADYGELTQEARDAIKVIAIEFDRISIDTSEV